MYNTIQKTIIAWAFNHYIAYYYFDNVNVNQLKVAFEKGEIELDNLPVKKDALKHLKLPWNVVSGVVGKLSIRIPLLSPLTDPWLIKLDNLMLIVSPAKQSSLSESRDQSRVRMIQDSSDANIQEYLDNSLIHEGEDENEDGEDDDDDDDDSAANEKQRINSEETKLAEFYSSFSATVSSMVKDIHRNIKLEINSMTLLFEDFNHGLVKFSADSLLLHRPYNVRNIVMENVSVYLSRLGPHTWNKRDDLLRVNLDSCNIDLCDVSNNGGHTSLEINSETEIKGNLYFVGSIGTSSIPLCEFLLEDFRMLYFTGDHQQDGSIFAKISCCHFNREESSWDNLLKPWPFNLSWDKRLNHRKFSLTSDEQAEFTMSSALLDLVDVVIKRILTDNLQSKLWPVARNPVSTSQHSTNEFNTILVLHNETGHRLQYACIDGNSDLCDLSERSKSISPTLGLSGVGGDNIITQSLIHKLSISSRSSADNDKDSSTEFQRSTKWIGVNNGETVSLESITKSILVRVEGWKTLLPIHLDKTGLFFREACSDRVKNEDTYIVISIDLEEKSARKIISIRSPLNLVNSLDATLEVHFGESNQALYIKPDGQLAVPLPYLLNRMHIRPCNVGVTMSEQAIVWDEFVNLPSFDRLHICYPVTITNKKHASYCTSHAFRICTSMRRERESNFDDDDQTQLCSPVPVFSITFMPPLTIVNLLPCELKYSIGEISGSLTKGSQQKIHQVDTTRPADLFFSMNGFPRSKAIKIDPGATGSFQHTLEMIDKNNRSLYLDAKIVLASLGEEPAVQVIIHAPFWFINKTRLPLVFKQEGAALEAAGQFREHEDKFNSTLLFSFYDTELEPPWLCSIRLGKSRGASMWCDGFKLEKGSGQRRLCFIPKNGDGEPKLSRYMIDINIGRGFGRYSETTIVTLTTRYGFDSITKTPKKIYESSPQDCKLFYYNYNTNLAQHIGGRSSRQLFTNHSREGISEISFIAPGLKLILVDSSRDRIVEVSIENVMVKSTTKAKEQIIDCSLQDVRIENALPDCEKSIILDRGSSLNESLTQSPAVRLIMDRILGKSFGTVWFRQVQLSMCELVLNIEEKVFLKLVEFISFRNRRRPKNLGNLTRDLERILHPEEDRLSKYYFDLLRIDLSSLKLSVFTSTNLPSSLQKLKSCLGLKFFGFEDAQVQLSPYFKMNVSRTMRGIFESVSRFYKRQISEQAPRIVGQQIQNYLRFHLSDLLSSLYDEVYNKLFY